MADIGAQKYGSIGAASWVGPGLCKDPRLSLQLTLLAGFGTWMPDRARTVSPWCLNGVESSPCLAIGKYSRHMGSGIHLCLLPGSVVLDVGAQK